MKTFVVLKKIGNFAATEDRSFNELKDAVQYKTLCELANESDYITYHIAEIKVEDGMGGWI